MVIIIVIIMIMIKLSDAGAEDIGQGQGGLQAFDAFFACAIELRRA